MKATPAIILFYTILFNFLRDIVQTNIFPLYEKY